MLDDITHDVAEVVLRRELSRHARHHEVLAALDVLVDDDRQSGGNALPHGGGTGGEIARVDRDA